MRETHARCVRLGRYAASHKQPSSWFRGLICRRLDTIIVRGTSCLLTYLLTVSASCWLQTGYNICATVRVANLLYGVNSNHDDGRGKHVCLLRIIFLRRNCDQNEIFISSKLCCITDGAFNDLLVKLVGW